MFNKHPIRAHFPTQGSVSLLQSLWCTGNVLKPGSNGYDLTEHSEEVASCNLGDIGFRITSHTQFLKQHR